MRYAALVVGLIGVLGAGFTGVVRLNMIEKDLKPKFETARVLKDLNPAGFADAERVYNKITWSTYALLGAAALGLVACVVVMLRKGVIAGVLFLVAYAVPLAILQEGVTAAFPGGLALAGILSFFVRSRTEPKYGAGRRRYDDGAESDLGDFGSPAR